MRLLAMEGVVNTQVDTLKSMNINTLNVDEILDYLLMILPGYLLFNYAHGFRKLLYNGKYIKTI